ncbi:MAG: preprotein translocase subunit YajC [Oscillospiraceae bacterium]|nr:preprotein translocase subunit YajC [Oscillospiraceae bacterium]
MSSNFGSFLPIIIIFVVFYFLLIRPENKKKKEIAKMRSNLKVGDEITTIGGIMGRVTNVRDDQLTIESSNDRSKLRIAKWAVSTVDKAREVPEDTAE